MMNISGLYQITGQAEHEEPGEVCQVLPEQTQGPEFTPSALTQRLGMSLIQLLGVGWRWADPHMNATGQLS